MLIAPETFPPDPGVFGDSRCGGQSVSLSALARFEQGANYKLARGWLALQRWLHAQLEKSGAAATERAFDLIAAREPYASERELDTELPGLGAAKGALFRARWFISLELRQETHLREHALASQRPTIVQFNLSPTLGGAEVYTASFSRALKDRGWPTRVVVSGAARFWDDLDFGGVPRVLAGAPAAALGPGDIAVVQAPLPAALLAEIANSFVVGVAHQAIYDGTRPGYYDCADLLLAVSGHVAATLERHGLTRVYPTPLYGAADLWRGPPTGLPVEGPLFDIDARKPRDRLVWGLHRLRAALTGPRRFTRRAGLTLGVVSRLAPLKQFPRLFELLVPVLTRHPDVLLEIFGSAVGYTSLAALRCALAPLGSRVRFWGHQRDVASAYRSIDYLLSGLPEREALGLNLLEACSIGTPVIAIDAPPFSETMREAVTGFLYADPRGDNGADFERVLNGILAGTVAPDRAAAPAHLDPFSFARFAERLDAVFLDLTARVAITETAA